MASTQAIERTGDDLALDRTVLAAERTLMAWIRTAFSMISFGFTMFKFLQQVQSASATRVGVHGPRNLAMVLIGLGTLSLIAAIAQHISYMNRLGRGRGAPLSLATVVAVLVVLTGLLAFAGVAARHGPF